MILPHVRLVDGPLVDKRQAVVNSMADDLVRLGRTGTDSDALFALMETRSYSNYECMLLVDGALFEARQKILGREMAKA